MPNTPILNVSWANASDNWKSTLITGITGKNRWMAKGPSSASAARITSSARVGMFKVQKKNIAAFQWWRSRFKFPWRDDSWHKSRQAGGIERFGLTII